MLSRLGALPRAGRSPMWSNGIALTVAAVLMTAPAYADSPQYHLGRTPTAAEIDAWNIDVLPNGQGLPPGHGSVTEGREIFAETCAACHGDKGQGGPAER